MKKTLKIMALVLAFATLTLTFAACGNAPAQEDEKLIFGTNAEFPPFEFVTANVMVLI